LGGGLNDDAGESENAPKKKRWCLSGKEAPDDKDSDQKDGSSDDDDDDDDDHDPKAPGNFKDALSKCWGVPDSTQKVPTNPMLRAKLVVPAASVVIDDWGGIDDDREMMMLEPTILSASEVVDVSSSRIFPQLTRWQLAKILKFIILGVGSVATYIWFGMEFWNAETASTQTAVGNFAASKTTEYRPRYSALDTALTTAETFPSSADSAVDIVPNSSCVHASYRSYKAQHSTSQPLVYLAKVLSPSCNCKRWSGAVPPDAGCGYAGTCVAANGTCFPTTTGKCGDDRAATLCEKPATDVDDVALTSGEGKAYKGSLAMLSYGVPSSCRVTVTLTTDYGAHLVGTRAQRAIPPNAFNVSTDVHRKYWCEDGVAYEGFAASCRTQDEPTISRRIELNGTNDTARLSAYRFGCKQADTASEVDCRFNSRFFDYFGPIPGPLGSNNLTFSGAPREVSDQIANFSFFPGCLHKNYTIVASIQTDTPQICSVNSDTPLKLRIRAESQLEQVVTGSVVDGRCLNASASSCFTRGLMGATVTAVLPCYDSSTVSAETDRSGNFKLAIPYARSFHGMSMHLAVSHRDGVDWTAGTLTVPLAATERVEETSRRYQWVDKPGRGSLGGYCQDVTTGAWANASLCAAAGIDLCAEWDTVPDDPGLGLGKSLRNASYCECYDKEETGSGSGAPSSMATCSSSNAGLDGRGTPSCAGCILGTWGPCQRPDGTCYAFTHHSDGSRFCAEDGGGGGSGGTNTHECAGWPCSCAACQANTHAAPPVYLWPKAETTAPSPVPSTAPPTTELRCGPRPTGRPTPKPTRAPTRLPTTSLRPTPVPSTSVPTPFSWPPTRAPSPLPTQSNIIVKQPNGTAIRCGSNAEISWITRGSEAATSCPTV
jgi:hypothetical protein